MTFPSPHQTLIHSLLNQFLQLEQCGSQSQPQIIRILCQIRKCVEMNPRNLAHLTIGSLSAVELFEFVIDILSSIKSRDCEKDPDQPSRKLLMHVMSLMLKMWVPDGESLKNIYNGILDLIEQRQHCIDGCLQFMICFVGTMQDIPYAASEPLEHHSTQKEEVDYCKYEHYFAHHMLNEFIGLANIFLDRAMVKNNTASSFQSVARKKHSFQQQSQKQQSTAIVYPNEDALPNSIDTPEKRQSGYSQNFRLYIIKVSETRIRLLIRLFSACLSYDFQYLSRSQQQDRVYQSTHQIILPTKFSKHCKFQEFDLFLKEDSTTEKLNYLFLITEQCNRLKIDIIELLAVMSRIHFRYFKNKILHRVFLENIGYVLLNLMTGLDFEDNVKDCRDCSHNAFRGETQHKLEFKIDLCVAFGEAIAILLNHQQTFYTLQPSLLSQFLTQVQEFICNQLLETTIANSPGKLQLSLETYVLLHAKFINMLVDLKSNFQIYMVSNQRIMEQLLNMILEVGSKYEDYLHAEILNWYQSDDRAELLCLEDLKILLHIFKIYRPRKSGTFSVSKMYHLLCRFEHGFHIISGTTYLHPWQLHNCRDYIEECVAELDQAIRQSMSLMQRNGLQIDNLLKETVLPYFVSMAVRECRSGRVQLDMLTIMEWVMSKSIYRNCDMELIQDILTIQVQQQRYYEQLSAKISPESSAIAQHRTRKQRLINYVLTGCTQSLSHLYKSQQLNLLARIIFTLLLPQHYLQYCQELRAVFGLSGQARYCYTVTPKTQHTVLVQVLEQIKNNRYVFCYRQKCSEVYCIIRDQYIHFYDPYKPIANLQSTGSLQVCTLVMQLESESWHVQREHIEEIMEVYEKQLSQLKSNNQAVYLMLLKAYAYLLQMLKKHKQTLKNWIPQLVITVVDVLASPTQDTIDPNEATSVFFAYWELTKLCVFAYFEDFFLIQPQFASIQPARHIACFIHSIIKNLLHLHANSEYDTDCHVSRSLYDFLSVQLFREIHCHIQDQNIKDQLIQIAMRHILSCIQAKAYQVQDLPFVNLHQPHLQRSQPRLDPYLLIKVLSVHEHTLSYLISKYPAFTYKFCHSSLLIQCTQLIEDKGLSSVIEYVYMLYDGHAARDGMSYNGEPEAQQLHLAQEGNFNVWRQNEQNLKIGKESIENRNKANDCSGQSLNSIISQASGIQEGRGQQERHEQIDGEKQPSSTPSTENQALGLDIQTHLKPTYFDEELEVDTSMPSPQHPQL